MMKGETIIFWLLAALTLGTALLAVTSRQIFRAAIYLLFSLLGVAGIYFWLHYEFVAAVQIVVYAGGIAVLIIFSVFLTQRSGEDLPKPSTGRMLVAGLATLSGLALVMFHVLKHAFPVSILEPSTATVADLGRRMLHTGEGGFALPFEVVSILLLAAMVGCIVIAMRVKNKNL
ncbi:MAG: NADH-quinone oxidoreductase subunit J [Bacteroidetes bacterium]|nr:NADH-quinone oxidoreductase subunit J [Bacteroidota bacterium]